MADGDIRGDAPGDPSNTGQAPGSEPVVPSQAHAGAYPPYPPNPAGMPPGAQGQPFPHPPYGYPPYPYPSAAYPPPAQYAYPYPYAAPQPVRQSNRALWITLSIVGGVLLVVCVSCSVLFAISISRTASNVNKLLGPTLAVTTFCVDVQDQEYSVAYDQLSRSLQSQMTRDAFVAAALAHDQSSGRVTDCTPDTNSPPADPNRPPVMVSITITRGSGSSAFTSNGELTLIQEGGAWKIDVIDSSLGLT